MAISFRGKKVEVYDRSLLYMSDYQKASEEELARYGNALIECGVDMLIAPADMMPLWQRLIPEVRLLCATNYQHEKYQNEECQIVKIRLSEIKNMTEKIRRMKKREKARIKAVCLSDFDLPDYEKHKANLKTFKRYFPEIRVGIAPGNHHQTGTATVIELADDFDFVIGSFAGNAPSHQDVPVEQILLASVIFGDGQTSNLEKFQEIKVIYETMTNIKLSVQQPVIGERIFYYESAIHADGIEKNPMTYEPFSPESVGLTRKMFIGKHSGIKSIEKKSKELSLSVPAECLERIKEKIKQVCLVKKGHIDDDAFSVIVNDCLACR